MVLSPHDEMLASSQARASRLKRMRRLTFMYGRICKKTRFLTISKLGSSPIWRANEKRARLILKAFKAEGIFCSYEWLMLGVGDGPVFARHTEHAMIDTGRKFKTLKKGKYPQK